jgi:hypothetical protein
MGREYPLGYEYFRNRCRTAFAKQRHLTDAAEIERGLERAQYVMKELEALWMLRVRRPRCHDSYRKIAEISGHEAALLRR